MEEAHNQEVQKRKQMELRQEEERRRREEELRAHSEDLMRRQQGQGGNFSEKVSLSFPSSTFMVCISEDFLFIEFLCFFRGIQT